MNQVMMPAGEYYIGDLCYVLSAEWDECCELFFAGGSNQSNKGEFTLKGVRRFISYDTMYGDGSYQTNTGGNIDVDSGSIGCILVSDIRDMQISDIRSSGVIHVFDKPFFSFTHKGTLYFGDLSVNTGINNDDTDEDMDYYPK
jgi:hypothetical protein